MQSSETTRRVEEMLAKRAAGEKLSQRQIAAMCGVSKGFVEFVASGAVTSEKRAATEARMATNKKKRAELLAARPKDYVGPRDYAAKTIKHRYENRKSKVDHLVDLPSENDCYDPFVSDDDEHGSARFMKLDLAQLAEWKSSRNNPNQGHCDECDRDGYAVRLKRGKRVLNLCVRHACELIIREAQDSFHLREEAA